MGIPAIEVHDLSMRFGNRTILHDINLTIQAQKILAIVGGSGAGKTTLLRSILLLNAANGSIKLFGTEIRQGDAEAKAWAKKQWGVMFQHGALFSSLTVLENIAFPLREFTQFSDDYIAHLAHLKILLVGLKPESAGLYPAELSGGMKKRVAIARALALDPKLLFLDEPTAGLDPHGASELDDLILELRDSLDLTVVMVTHDLDTLWRTTDQVAFLGHGEVLAVGAMSELAHSENEMIQAYFSDIRARMAEEKYTHKTSI